MTGKEKTIALLVSVSSGSGTGTIPMEWSLSRRFRVVPPSEASTYTFVIKDLAGDKVWQRATQNGLLSQQDFLSMGICATVEISGATVDGTYKVKFDLH